VGRLVPAGGHAARALRGDARGLPLARARELRRVRHHHHPLPGAGNRYYLVVPSDGTIEGSYGVDGDGNERTPSAAACFPPSFDTCAP